MAPMPTKDHKKPAVQRLLAALDRDLQRETLGVLLIALGGVTALALLSITKGAVTAAWVHFLRRVFGWGVYPAVVALVGGGVALLWDELRRRVSFNPRSLVGLEVLWSALLGMTHLFYPLDKSLSAAERGLGGGYIGWSISYFLVTAMGRATGFVLLLLSATGSLALVLRLSRDDLQGIALGLRAYLTRRPTVPVEQETREPMAQAGAVIVKQRKRPSRSIVAPQPEPSEHRAASSPATPRRVRRERSLPPLDLLESGSDEMYGEADIRYREKLIEETLANFGVPAKVVEVRQGPTVTQFGVEPGFLPGTGPDGQSKQRKIRVGQIMALQDDLALALAASPIRIEAPVPGRSVVGIEVPNDKPSLVRLRSTVESKSYRAVDSRLRFALGKDVSGQSVAADLGQMPHLLIAGATGSGKSVCINAITACLLLDNTPDDLRLVMVDPKMVELTNYNGIPHLLGPVITNVEAVVRALRWITAEMDRRYHQFAEAGTRNVDAHNDLMVSRGRDKLPYIVVMIDELADLMMTAPDEIERLICRIAQLARATGIHLVIATQRPSVDVITGLIKANFPARISFAVTTQVDSRVVLDTPGAEKLLGRGDMLYMASDSSKLLRLQGCYVSDAELERLANFWKEKGDWAGGAQGIQAPWRDIGLGESGDEDDLLEQAIELTKGRSTISTSFLQRRLRIGFPRAAHLIDLMEAQDYVGPAEDGGRSREVLPQDEDTEGDENTDEPAH